MRPLRGLVPYAALAILIVGATVVALAATTLSVPAAVVAVPATARPSPAASFIRPSTDLSPSGRLAYWRVEANGDYLLWLANADNSRRRSVAKADQPNAVGRTKWSADGSAVAYVDSGVRLVVVRVDGTRSTYTLAPELRAEGYRIVDHRFSPSGERIAATVQRATGSQTDVYVSGVGGTWTRLTTTEDVIAGDWLTENELLVQTTAGIIGRLRAADRDQMRPLTGLPGATPLLGDDGRIHFLSGRVAPFAGASETLVYASGSSVWSMTADGEDLRREPVTLETDNFRLDGQWPGGYLLHRGTNPAQVAVARTAVDLPTSAGIIERLEVSSDKKLAIGFAGGNLIRVDLAPTGAVGNPAVLLGSVSQGDAWFPRTASLATAAAPRVDVPAARYVFALGKHLWSMGADGLPTLLRAANTNAQTLGRFTLPPPAWSPAGDRVLTVESLSTGTFAFQLIAVSVARDGTARRYTTPSSVGPGVTWSPDGTQILVVALPAASTDPVVLASDLNVSILDAASGTVVRTLPGREAVWTASGIVVVSNGTIRTGDRARDGQALELWNGSAARQITAITKLIGPLFAGADPTAQTPLTARGNTQTGGLSASPDGAYVGVHVNFLAPSPIVSYAIIRVRDSVTTKFIFEEAVTDEAWASTGRYLGYTRTVANAPQRAIVRDAETGESVMDVEGRFAGWSPDGLWTYIARADGLYAKQLSGGDAVRFSPFGVPVSATKP